MKKVYKDYEVLSHGVTYFTNSYFDHPLTGNPEYSPWGMMIRK